MKLFPITMAVFLLFAPGLAFADWNTQCSFDMSNDDREWETDSCDPGCWDYDVRRFTDDNDDDRCQVSKSSNSCEARLRSRDGTDCNIKFRCYVRCYR